VYLAEFIRCEKLSLREDTSAFHHNGATFGFKSRVCMALGHSDENYGRTKKSHSDKANQR